MKEEIRRRAEENLSVVDGRATLPCPFCGAAGFFAFDVPDQRTTIDFRTECSECKLLRFGTVDCDPDTMHITVTLYDRPRHS